MTIWFFFFIIILGAAARACAGGERSFLLWRRESRGAGIRAAEALFHELEETLASGWVPNEERWAKLRELEEPWATLSSECLALLRSEGASVVPTLKRFRELARRHFEALSEARAKSVQAMAQAGVCFVIIPLFSVVLRLLLPEIAEVGKGWWLFTCVVTSLGAISGLWIWKMAESARWGGLRGSEREWMLQSLVFAERLLAFLRLGRSPDRAWADSIQWLPAELLAAWGADPWKAEEGLKKQEAESLREALLNAGVGLKRAIQASLWDGHPCSERIEANLVALRAEIKAYQEKELQSLPTRALQPLFFLTAPGVLALLGAALFLSVGSAFDSI